MCRPVPAAEFGRDCLRSTLSRAKFTRTVAKCPSRNSPFGSWRSCLNVPGNGFSGTFKQDRQDPKGLFLEGHFAVLLERPGETVTREELQSRLWPADTYVGFDEGLNTAIRKLRVAFGDSAENPRFFQTIPRRGYRFIAPLHEVPGSLQTAETVDDLTISPSRPPSASFKTPAIVISAAILLLLLFMAGFSAYRRPSQSPVS